MVTTNRQLAGVPAGGQFAPSAAVRSTVSLEGTATKRRAPMTVTNLGLRPHKSEHLIRVKDLGGNSWVGTKQHLVRETALDATNQLTAVTLATRVDTPPLQLAFVASMFTRARNDLIEAPAEREDNEHFAYSTVLDGVAGPGSIEPGRVYHVRYGLAVAIAGAWEKTGHEIRFSSTGRLWSAWRDEQMNAIAYAPTLGTW